MLKGVFSLEIKNLLNKILDGEDIRKTLENKIQVSEEEEEESPEELKRRLEDEKFADFKRRCKDRLSELYKTVKTWDTQDIARNITSLKCMEMELYWAPSPEQVKQILTRASFALDCLSGNDCIKIGKVLGVKYTINDGTSK